MSTRMRKTMAAAVLAACLQLVSPGSASAQITSAPTLVINATTGQLNFTASVEQINNVTFGTPPVPVLTNYLLDFFVRAAITDATTCASTPAAPALTVDLGKPTPNASNVISTAKFLTLAPTLAANTEYYACVRANGPAGPGPRSAVGKDAVSGLPVPFGFPAVPGKAATPTVGP